MQTGGPMPVEAFDRDQKFKLATGKLITIDNQIDTTTGTVKLKAEFANTDSTLFPNQFVNVRMIVETRPDATLVPTPAIQRGAPGTFVYVVRNGNTVSVAPVKLGPTQGEVTAVDSGVVPGDMVVVDGTDKLREGARVEIITREAQSAPGPGGGRRGQGQGKGGGQGKAESGQAKGDRPADGAAPGDGQRRRKSAE
jgi:multidrug efflux system membrane fusion protein